MKLTLQNTCYNLAMEQLLCNSEIGEDMVKIPQDYLVDSTDELIDKVFPELENGYMDKYFVSHRAILTPLNDNVDKINEVIMAKFPGEGKTLSVC